MNEVSERFRTGRVICRFSCGAASAVATKLAIEKYGKVEIFYNDTGSEDDDNPRFLADCERWFGQSVIVLKSTKYNNTFDVFEDRRFLVGFGGAPCTSELKRIPGDAVWSFGDVEVFGYTEGERRRVDRFREDNPERIIETPLIDLGITKSDCFERLIEVGIALPVMYRRGFRNNNCKACVKARDSIDYWKRTRLYYPDEFWRMASLERKYGFALNRRTKDGVRSPIFLDEIEPGPPANTIDPSVSCGLFCGADNQ